MPVGVLFVSQSAFALTLCVVFAYGISQASVQRMKALFGVLILQELIYICVKRVIFS